MLEQVDPLNMIDISQIDSALGHSLGVNRISFGELVSRAITGQLDLSFGSILRGILNFIFMEVTAHISLMQQLIFVAVLASLLKVLTDTFQAKAAGELGFYVSYITLVAIIFSSFRIGVTISIDMITNVTNFIRISIPVIITLVLMSGNATGAYVYNSLFIFAINIINTVIINIVMPVIIFLVTIQVVNYLTENEILKNMSDFISKYVNMGTKALAGVFISVLALQRISAPIINNAAIRGARLTINAVPVVGGALSSAVDSALYLAQGAKSGVIVAVVIAIIYICIVPITKLFAMMFVYKFVAAIIQPICDKRIVKCMNTIGNYTGLLLGVSVMVMVMFSIALIMLVSF
ncbi:MAG: stage III sporulation protein AE [Defluviitaleaceae bacterium]|nr:stage III sporulation protein AE [Defluviitaleaceae bacterium]